MNGSSFEQTWIPFGCTVAGLVEIGPVVLEKKIFKFCQCIFLLFCNYLPLEKGGALHLKKNLIPFTQGYFMPSLVEIGPVVLEKILIFLLFQNYLPLENGGGLHLNKLESPSVKDALCQVWLKLVPWFLKRFLKFRQCIFVIS